MAWRTARHALLAYPALRGPSGDARRSVYSSTASRVKHTRRARSLRAPPPPGLLLRRCECSRYCLAMVMEPEVIPDPVMVPDMVLPSELNVHVQVEVPPIEPVVTSA